MTATEEQISVFLRQFEAAFTADGAKFKIVECSPASIRIQILLDEQTCRDCIMPQEVIQEIIESNLRQTFDIRPSIQISFIEVLLETGELPYAPDRH